MYDYLSAVCDDIREYLRDHAYSNAIKARVAEEYDELFDELYDTLWTTDSVTGNASGSYTFNTWKAEEYLCHNMDLFFEALDEFGFDRFPKNFSAEAADVIIRCYVLSQALTNVLDEYK